MEALQSVMLGPLELKTIDGDIIHVDLMTYVDESLPFDEYLDAKEDSPSSVDMVIGGGLAWKYVFSSVEFRNNDGSLVTSHKLGKIWLSCGARGKEHSGSLMTAKLAETQKNDSCSRVRFSPADRENDMRELQRDPLYSSTNDNKLTMSITDEEVLEEYKNTVELVELENGENHLQFNLSWAFGPKTTPNNYAQAKNAALKLLRKLEDKPDLRAQYCKKIESAISEGHIVRIPEDDLRQDLSNSSKPQYYIPHFNTSQSKFSVVYDAARQYQGMSLNKLLNRGPIFLQSLRSILTRFGERKYGVAGDIANMFFQIRIAPRDQDMLRILWFSAPEMKGDVVAYKFKVAPYGLRCIPSMAGYSLAYTADKNMVKVSTDAIKRVTRDMFVDDFITGVDTIEEGRRVIDEVSLLLSSTGFRLTKWNASNKRHFDWRGREGSCSGFERY